MTRVVNYTPRRPFDLSLIPLQALCDFIHDSSLAAERTKVFRVGAD